MNDLAFVKMHGIGNDFIIIDCIKYKFSEAELISIAKIGCDRHFGIGSDGLILVCNSDICDFKMRMLNPDGSEAEMCGNGIRVFAKYIYDYKLSNKINLSAETLAGVKFIDLYINDDKCTGVRVDMGEPRLLPQLIPFNGAVGKDKIVSEKLTVIDKDFYITCVNMGNPHCITIVEDVDLIDLGKYGPAIENHEAFPQRTNVEFIQIIDDENIKMRVWERGAAETLACGTGACGSAVAAMLNGKAKRKVNMHLAGGDLIIEWTDDNRVLMTGPCEEVFDGVIKGSILESWIAVK